MHCFLSPKVAHNDEQKIPAERKNWATDRRVYQICTRLKLFAIKVPALLVVDGSIFFSSVSFQRPFFVFLFLTHTFTQIHSEEHTVAKIFFHKIRIDDGKKAQQVLSFDLNLEQDAVDMHSITRSIDSQHNSLSLFSLLLLRAYTWLDFNGSGLCQAAQKMISNRHLLSNEKTFNISHHLRRKHSKLHFIFYSLIRPGNCIRFFQCWRMCQTW